MIKTFFLAKLSKALNTYLNLDPESKSRLKKIKDKIITIQCEPLIGTFHCHFNAENVEIKTESSAIACAKITGTPMQMMAVMLDKDERHTFFADDLKIEGDAEFAQQVIDLFDELEIDWEEHVSHILGDAPAHYLGRTFQKISHWLDNTKTAMTDNINEYVHEEARWLPAREALNDFFLEIDHFRMDVDRAEIKITYLDEYINKREVKE